MKAVPLTYRAMLPAGIACFVLAALTGIWRIALVRGFTLPPLPPWWPPHSHLMIGGFLALLIMFERMVALRIGALAWAPYAYSATAVLLHTGWWPVRIVHAAALCGWLAHRWLAFRQFHHWEKPLVEGAAYVTLSSALNYPGGLPARPEVALAGLAFAIAVIAVERLEIALYRADRLVRSVYTLLFAWTLIWIPAAWLGFPSLPVLGMFTLLLVPALVSCDTALRTSFRRPGLGSHALHKFLNAALLLSYAWLLLAAVAMIFSRHLPAAVMKDVLFHLFGLGFVMTMILGHAPVILPAAVGKLPPEKAHWGLFLAFEAATVIRIAGDLAVARGPVAWALEGWITGTIHLVTFLAYMFLTFRDLL